MPRAELDAYQVASGELHDVTYDVLDVVSPYERGIERAVAEGETVLTSSLPGVTPMDLAANPADVTAAMAEAQGQVPVESIYQSLATDCAGRIGPGRYCYLLRSAYASLGDPALVGAYRNAADVVARYNAMLAAYAGGVSGQVLAADLERFKTAVGGGLALTGSGLAAVPALSAAFAALKPIATRAGELRDREAFRTFLLDNYSAVDDLLAAMAVGSTELYHTVFVNTQDRIIGAPGSERAALERRRDDIRGIVANWTVLIDDSRDLLRELRLAVADPGALEPRLREMGLLAVRSLSQANVVRDQIRSLGQPVP